MKFRAAILIGPEFIAGGHGAIDDGTYPVVGSCRVKGNLTFNEAEAGDAAWWVVIIG